MISDLILPDESSDSLDIDLSDLEVIDNYAWFNSLPAFLVTDHNGSVTSNVVDVPDDATVVVISTRRCTSIDPGIWGIGVAMSLNIEMFDRLSWLSLGGKAGELGGLHYIDGGVATERTHSVHTTELIAGSGRKLRVTHVISGGSAKTGTSIEWL